MAKLILKFKEAVIREIPLEKESTTLGRGQGNDIMIDNMAVSGSHARIVKEGNRYVLEDLNSTNGTYVNDHRVSKQALTNNAIITIGKHTLQFIDPQAADATMIRKPVSSDATVVIAQPTPAAESRAVAGGGARESLGIISVIEGATERQEYELTKRVSTIGKAPTAEIKLKGFFAPKVAALINRTKEGYYINPAGGEKQPLINGKQIDSAYLLKNLDVIEVASLRLQFTLKDE